MFIIVSWKFVHLECLYRADRGIDMDSEPGRTAGVIISAELVKDYDSWDIPASSIRGEIKDDVGDPDKTFMFTNRTFRGWFEAKPLVGKRVRFTRVKGQLGYMAEHVELE